MAVFVENLSKLDEIPVVLRTPVFDKAFKIAEVCNLNQQEKMAWDAYLKAKWDNENSMAYAKEEAIEEGMKEGFAKGIAKGREEGREEGLLLTARNMKAKGFDLQTIAEITGLSVGEIKNA